MNRMLIVGSIMAALAGSGSASAQESLYLGGSDSIQRGASVGTSSVPAGAQLVDLERWFGRNITFSVRPAPPYQTHPGRRQGVLGFISSTPFPGGATLYGCMANDYSDRFTSREANCEGHLPMPQIPITGYVAAIQLPGTVPLYRCMRVGGLPSGRWGDHFDTTDANCEGKPAVFNGILGYIWQ
ncbi:hypothetical protein [Stenotrophomonas sp. PD6]|uniref:hypothetical protein n=1 Tax=Stenotrophomonas sp. PD6 TaxID=3368612 RepID=UPI003BA280E6